MRQMLLLGLSMVFPLRADGLSDLKIQLGRLNGVEPLNVAVERQIGNRMGEEKKSILTQGSASAWVEESPQGLKLFWSREQIRKATQEQRAKETNPESTTPTDEIMSSLKPADLQDYFNSAEKIRVDVEHGRFVEERADSLDGKPARLFTFSLEPSADERKVCNKAFEATLKIWVGPDGIPMGKSITRKGKGRLLAFFNFEGQYYDEYRFARMGNRLVTLRHQHEDSVSGSNAPSRKGKQITTLSYR